MKVIKNINGKKVIVCSDDHSRELKCDYYNKIVSDYYVFGNIVIKDIEIYCEVCFKIMGLKMLQNDKYTKF